ncbi:unnamed protein product [Calypogeia fissa]
MATTKVCLFLVLLYAIPATAITTVFHTNCTRPAPGSYFNFVSAPNSRGTLQLLWSCVFTLITCTWTVQHVDIPRPEDEKKPIGDKVWMTLVTLLVPEFLVGRAFEDLVNARASVTKMQAQFPNIVWTLTHAFYAEMGGYILRGEIASTTKNNEEAPPTTKNDEEAPPTTKNDEEAPPTTKNDEEAPPPTNLTFSPDDIVLITKRIMKCIELGVLPSQPRFLSKKGIQRKAKADIFLKCLTAFQVSWFAVQVCARKALNQPISQLEISVLAYCVCTILCYLAWMKKPQDAIVPELFSPIRTLTSEERKTVEDLTRDPSPALGFMGIFGGSLFGAVHLLAWNLHFPTHTEKVLWRASTIITTSILLPLGILISCVPEDLTSFRKYVSKFLKFLMSVVVSLYFISRIFIMVEIFRSLGYLPSGAYETTWSTNVPHVM